MRIWDFDDDNTRAAVACGRCDAWGCLLTRTARRHQSRCLTVPCSSMPVAGTSCFTMRRHLQCHLSPPSGTCFRWQHRLRHQPLLRRPLLLLDAVPSPPLALRCLSSRSMRASRPSTSRRQLHRLGALYGAVDISRNTAAVVALRWNRP
jgi:hypothetical protein